MSNGVKTVRRMGGVGLAVCLAGAAMAMTGCNTNRGQGTIRALTDRNEALRQDLETCQSEREISRQALAKRDSTIAEQRTLIAQLRTTNLESAQAMERWGNQLGGIAFSQIDPMADMELRRFAESNPDLVTYDSSLGMLRFKSDLTFDSGSDVVKPGAKASLSSLASVLNSSAASKYDIRVVGHTDNQPISAPTAQRGHPTNMHLSCHRAISVRKELTAVGVAPERIEAAGRGEFDPLVPNNASGGTPANRRVEIYLVRRIESGAPIGGAAAEVPEQVPAAPEIMK